MQLDLHLVNHGYNPRKVYLIWDDPYTHINDIKKYFKIYKNNQVLIEGYSDDFKKPSMFDHDHHTNLFRKRSTHQFCFLDEDLQDFREYEYYVEMECYSISKIITDEEVEEEIQEEKTLVYEAKSDIMILKSDA